MSGGSRGRRGTSSRRPDTGAVVAAMRRGPHGARAYQTPMEASVTSWELDRVIGQWFGAPAERSFRRARRGRSRADPARSRASAMPQACDPGPVRSAAGGPPSADGRLPRGPRAGVPEGRVPALVIGRARTAPSRTDGVDDRHWCGRDGDGASSTTRPALIPVTQTRRNGSRGPGGGIYRIAARSPHGLPGAPPSVGGTRPSSGWGLDKPGGVSGSPQWPRPKSGSVPFDRPSRRPGRLSRGESSGAD